MKTGDPYMLTQFNGSAPGPMGDLMDASRATDNFRGHLLVVGQRMPEDGASPYDINPNNAAGHPATAETTWGVGPFQGEFMGKDIF